MDYRRGDQVEMEAGRWGMQAELGNQFRQFREVSYTREG
jgi:hypothetical protein